MPLLEQTRHMLDGFLASGTSLRELVRKAEGDVEYDWLKRFATGEINDPSVNRVQRLHDALRRMKATA